MTGRLDGKVALISGTGSGQGQAAAHLFAAEGAKVVGTDSNAAGGQQTLDDVRAAGGEMVSLHPLDLTVESEVERLVKFATDAYGDFNVLYNNAAAAMGGVIDTLTQEIWDWTILHDLTITFLVTRHAVPVLRRAGGGVVINTASVAGMMLGPASGGQLIHSVSKAGILRFTEVMANELARDNIRVVSISPGTIETGATAPQLAASPEYRARAEAGNLLGRLGRAEEIGVAAVFLASDEASYVTGVNLPVDGGRTASGGRGQAGYSFDNSVLQVWMEAQAAEHPSA